MLCILIDKTALCSEWWEIKAVARTAKCWNCLIPSQRLLIKENLQPPKQIIICQALADSALS